MYAAVVVILFAGINLEFVGLHPKLLRNRRNSSNNNL